MYHPDLLSGERQVAPTCDGIRADHVARYEWAAKHIAKGARVLDAACGVGYGAALLSEGRDVVAVDVNDEALKYARQYYPGPSYSQTDLSEGAPGGEFDAAVCFETIEHIADPRPLLTGIDAQELYASVPNETHFPYEDRIAFHHRHYTESDFRKLLTDCGWKVRDMAHQEGPESGVGDKPGRTLVARCERDPLHKLRGKHVSILGMGPSIDDFTDFAKRFGGSHSFCDEVWGINNVGGVFQCDRVFHMDDVRVQERRAEAQPKSNIANMLKWMRGHSGPIYTSHVDPGYPGLVPYPVQDVIQDLGMVYFNSTVAWAVAFAIHARVGVISLFGLDFSYQHSHKAERGRACVEFWLAAARARGIKINVSANTSLLDACEDPDSKLYGFDGYKVNVADNGEVTFEPRDLPTAQEVEARYNHDQPSSYHVRQGIA